MGKLIILSGPSGVGKGPLIKAFEAYLSAGDKRFHRHVLYTDRAARRGEADGVTYHFRRTDELEALAQRDGFHVYSVRGEQTQAVDLGALNDELSHNDFVLLEIFFEQIPSVAAFCAQRGFAVKRVFLTPLSDDDFVYLQCTTEAEKAIAVKAAMLTKLTNRGTEGRRSIEKRAGGAPGEIANNTDGGVIMFVNPYGEDNADIWHDVEKLFGSPRGLGVMKTFRDFIDVMEADTPPACRKSDLETARREAAEAEERAKEAEAQAEERKRIYDEAIEKEYESPFSYSAPASFCEAEERAKKKAEQARKIADEKMAALRRLEGKHQ